MIVVVRSAAMMNDGSTDSTNASNPGNGTAVVEMSAWRRRDDVLSTISFVFGGVHYGTVPLAVPYTRGQPLVLYFVPQNDGTGEVSGPLDCLVTDNPRLGVALEEAR
jgi:hypothetical protein